VIEAHVDDVPEGCMVFLGVKYSPGLVSQDAESVDPRSCENWEFVCLNQDDLETTDNPEDFPAQCEKANIRDSAHRVLEVIGLPAVCGDGLVTPPETCDDGLDNGTPGLCNANCDGIEPAVCGDEIITPPEECDGSNLAGNTCQDFGFFIGGALDCDSSCDFDTSGCFED
jgi:hypothetical protein